MNIDEANDSWKSIRSKIKEASDKQAQLNLKREDDTEIYWKIMELLDDQHALYNKLVREGFTPVNDGFDGVWVLES